MTSRQDSASHQVRVSSAYFTSQPWRITTTDSPDCHCDCCRSPDYPVPASPPGPLAACCCPQQARERTERQVYSTRLGCTHPKRKRHPRTATILCSWLPLSLLLLPPASHHPWPRCCWGASSATSAQTNSPPPALYARLVPIMMS